MAQLPQGVEITADITPAFADILTPEALAFVARLHRQFEGRRRELMAARDSRQAELDAGRLPDFLPQTASIRNGDWKIAPLPADLLDRRVEITGPVDRKMMINALNSGAKSFMADFEDSNCPSWENQISGQINVRDAYRKTISFASPEGKQYRLNDEIATLILRPFDFDTLAVLASNYALDERLSQAGWPSLLIIGLALPGVIWLTRQVTATGRRRTSRETSL